jgi:hypothetical protein
MRALTATLAALVILAVFPMTASAEVRQHVNVTCAALWNELGNPVPFVCLAEDVLQGGDKLALTGSSDIANLGNLGHIPSGLCGPKIYPDADNWNDCISSVWAKLGTNDSLCVYAGTNYTNIAWRAWAPSSPYGSIWTFRKDDFGGIRDYVSSVMLQQSGTHCDEGGG